MRISLLRQREPFGEILCQSLEAFFADQGLSCRCVWTPRLRLLDRLRQTLNSKRSRDYWVCNPYLNAIFRPGTPSSHFGPLSEEYGSSPSRWRAPLNRLFVWMSTRPLLAPLLCDSGLLLDPPPPGSDGWVILGGNQKLRILDPLQARSIVLQKDGCSSTAMEREVAMRRQAIEIGLPVPRILQVAESGRWIVEEYVVGTPLNRIGDASVRSSALHQALDAILRLGAATEETFTHEDYLALLQRDLEGPLEKLRSLDSEAHGEACRVRGLLLASLQSEGSSSLLASLAHGDFQAANVLVDGDGIRLIDWEYSGLRQAGYDLLVFHLGSRSPSGLSDCLSQFVTEGRLPSPDASGIQERWSTSEARLGVARLFLLEELILWISERGRQTASSLPPGSSSLLHEIDTFMTQWKKA